ncbi:Ubiquitin-like domain-containing protein CIP73 [Cardamine amara subsp. amara]|uniref:Ubiquitin-like domain-containing protein CIP73 n=1 Tax=Cardamine amara subsp. amara TaxID=228776 RepID=A0ABD1ALB1_CARAN
MGNTTGNTVNVTMALRRPLENDIITIRIEILHYITHNLRVLRNIPVPELKQDIDFYIGIPRERQYRLLFRGRALQDDQRLSDYHVEEGHTLYLVVSPEVPLDIVNSHSYQLTARQDDTPSVLIPDSLTTLSRHLNLSRREFAATYGNNAQTSTSRSLENRTAREPHWADVANTTRRLLTGEVAESLSSISTMLVDQVNVTDPSARELRQRRVVEIGRLLSNLGSSLITLGRATSRISMGDTQEDVSREVFMSTTGQNSLESHNTWLQTSIEAGRSIRATTLTRSLRNRQDFGVGIAIHEYENANNTLTTEEVLSDSDSAPGSDPEYYMVKTTPSLNMSKAKLGR